MPNKTVYFLGGLGVLGGIAYYASTRKKESPTPEYGTCPPGFHMMPDGTCMPNSEMPGYTPGSTPPPIPAWVTPELIAQYDKCFNGLCSSQEYSALILQLHQMLAAANDQQSKDFLSYFINELILKQGQPPDDSSSTSSGTLFRTPGVFPTPSFSAIEQPPPLPVNFPVTLSFSYVKCWYEQCSQQELDALYKGFADFIANPNNAFLVNQVVAARDAFTAHRLRMTQGRQTMGRHVGACSCQKRQEEMGTGACCSACERGEECEECGNHAAVG